MIMRMILLQAAVCVCYLFDRDKALSVGRNSEGTRKSLENFMDFDTRIPIFIFSSMLGINTVRILTEQRNKNTLKNDPQCGLTAGGREECTWDCEPIFDLYYEDPTCLSDCDHYPSCFSMLMEDLTNQDGVCSGSAGELNNWPVSSTPCNVTSLQIVEGICRPETEQALIQQQCINDLWSLPLDAVGNIEFIIWSICRQEIYDNFFTRPLPDCAADCVNIITSGSGTSYYEDPVSCLSNCPVTIIPETKNISSPNFPESRNYLYYVMTAKEGQTFDISFKYVDIQDSFLCLDSWILIIDGNGSELLPRYCGSQAPEPIKTQTNQAILIFLTNPVDTIDGFQADLSDGVRLEILNVTDTSESTKLNKKINEHANFLRMAFQNTPMMHKSNNNRLNPIDLVTSWTGIVQKPVFEHTRGRYPWICSLRSKPDREHYCGTTILSRPPGPLVMVTAAHCVYICKNNQSYSVPNCCCENVSGVGCSSDSGIECGDAPSVEVMTGLDAEIVCGDWETGNYTSEESLEEYNIILEIESLTVHPDYNITRGTNNSQFVVADIATIKVIENLSEEATSRLTPICLPEAHNPSHGVHAGWSSPPPLQYIKGELPLYEEFFRDFFKMWHYNMSIIPCQDPTQYFSSFGPTGVNLTYPTDSYYPPGTICAREKTTKFCPTSGESGSPLMVRNEQGRYSATGINSFIKGCSIFSIRSDKNEFSGNPIRTSLDQYSDNPTVYTRLSCYMSWVAEQYDMTYTPTAPDARCGEGTGDINEVGGEKCRTTPTNLYDRRENIEAVCIFPYNIDGREYNECTLTEIKDFTRPQFICPIRTIKGRINYTIADVDTNYCPTTNGPELELDPDNNDCGVPLRPVFATCKNTCPGVNFPIVSGGFALLATTGAALGGPAAAAGLTAGLTAAMPAVIAGLGLAGAAGLGMMTLDQCQNPVMCSAPSGQCCFLALDRGRIVCPLSC